MAELKYILNVLKNTEYCCVIILQQLLPLTFKRMCARKHTYARRYCTDIGNADVFFSGNTVIRDDEEEG